MDLNSGQTLGVDLVLVVSTPVALRPKALYSPAMPTMFDPLHWLASKGAVASLKDGEVALLFEQHTPQQMRQRIRRVVEPYMGLLKLQLDVEPGTRPRTVQQLVASGRLRIVEGKYRVVR